MTDIAKSPIVRSQKETARLAATGPLRTLELCDLVQWVANINEDIAFGREPIDVLQTIQEVQLIADHMAGAYRFRAGIRVAGKLMEALAEEAKSVAITDRNNGALDDYGTGKGGRAWLEGEWQLCELEALCVLIRLKCRDEGIRPDGFLNPLTHTPNDEPTDGSTVDTQDPEVPITRSLLVAACKELRLACYESNRDNLILLNLEAAIGENTGGEGVPTDEMINSRCGNSTAVVRNVPNPADPTALDDSVKFDQALVPTDALKAAYRMGWVDASDEVPEPWLSAEMLRRVDEPEFIQERDVVRMIGKPEFNAQRDRRIAELQANLAKHRSGE